MSEPNQPPGAGTQARGFCGPRRQGYLFLHGVLHPGTVIRHWPGGQLVRAGTPPRSPAGLRAGTSQDFSTPRVTLALASRKTGSTFGCPLAGASLTELPAFHHPQRAREPGLQGHSRGPSPQRPPQARAIAGLRGWSAFSPGCVELGGVGAPMQTQQKISGPFLWLKQRWGN